MSIVFSEKGISSGDLVQTCHDNEVFVNKLMLLCNSY